MTDQSTTATALQRLSTADLDLSNLPNRLDDQQLAVVEGAIKAPLPALPPVSEDHLSAALMMMLSTLPRKKAGELDGELFVASYQRQLGQYAKAQIDHLVDKAQATLRWFPTIVQCHEICSEWRRDDEFTKARIAMTVARHRELAARQSERPKWKPKPGELEELHRRAAESLKS